jgi:hypothetical protein
MNLISNGNRFGNNISLALAFTGSNLASSSGKNYL